MQRQHGRRTSDGDLSISSRPSHRWDQINLPPLGLLWKFGGGWRWLACGLVLAGILCLGASWPAALAFFAVALLLVWAFRSPRRPHPAPDVLVSPADGVIDTLQELTDGPLLDGRHFRIGIFLSLLDVHAVRAPISGPVERVLAVPGRHWSARALESGIRNQRYEVWLQDGRGARLCMRQIAGLVARRALFAPRPGDEILAGAVVGMIRFGSRVELYVPVSAYHVQVERGTRVRAGETVLAVRLHS
jgi:phosphatidylserine decarboxylase